jgi:hypothetical protein
MVAKIASDEKKPDGQTRIQPSREVESEFFGKLKGSLGSLRDRRKIMRIHKLYGKYMGNIS